LNSEVKTKSFHLIGDYLRFSSVTFAMKRVEYLKGFNGHEAELFFMYAKNTDSKLKYSLSRFKHFLFLRKKIKEQSDLGINIIHLYSLIDFILLILIVKIPQRLAICLSIYDLKINKVAEVLLRWLIKRVDHIFVSSRFVTDQFWSRLNIPPSRCTVLALPKYLERKDIGLVPIDEKQEKKKTISIGCFLAESSEIGKLARFKALVTSTLQRDDINIKLYLIKNNINQAYVPSNTSFGCIETIIANDDLDLLSLDFWLVFSGHFSCPYINDALKIGARVIAPSTHYTSELQRILKSRMLTYKANEVSSAAKLFISLIDNVISGAYTPLGLTSSSWQTERKYLLESYEKAVRRRLYLSRIS